MPIIGITGSFGTGKSFVASIFARLGVEVVDADKLAHEALGKGSASYKRVVSVFGKKILTSRGNINRKALAGIVFNDKARLVQLNRIVHPAVIRTIRERIRKSSGRTLVIDAPLIYEAGISGLMDILIVVKASRKNQVARCVKKFRMGEKDVCKRVSCQMPLKEKVKRADYVIDNDGTKVQTIKQVKQIWQEVKTKKEKRLWR